jgi:hypothetical protein
MSPMKKPYLNPTLPNYVRYHNIYIEPYKLHIFTKEKNRTVPEKAPTAAIGATSQAESPEEIVRPVPEVVILVV